MGLYERTQLFPYPEMNILEQGNLTKEPCACLPFCLPACLLDCPPASLPGVVMDIESYFWCLAEVVVYLTPGDLTSVLHNQM